MEKKVYDTSLFQKHPQWKQVHSICEKLSDFETYLAGGCVRDLVMQNQPKDFDIATSATPEQLVEIFPKALSVGREFGVIILAFVGFQIEIATFRTDGEYKDGRRPSTIEFATAEQDARRRDFTVNALFLNLKTSEVIDYVGGLQDIQSKKLKAVGDPLKRFTEDKLRMIRAVRFSSQLHFKIDEKTFEAIKKLSSEIRMVSSERIREELSKLLQTNSIFIGFRALIDSGLLLNLHPQLREFLSPKELEKILRIYSSDLSQIDLLTKFCILFAARVSQNQKDEYSQLKLLLKDFRFSSKELDKILWTLKTSFQLSQFHALDLVEQIRILASENFSILSQLISLYHSDLFKSLESEFAKLREQYLIDGKLPAPLLNGDDLKGLGIKPGHELGRCLEIIYNEQLEKKLKSKAQALERARCLVSNSKNIKI
jgi:tRNA nucleotidyltransferase/poly(A) polymerase